ncbi:DUF4124 domain-containing protein [Allochromatium vinosum]|uniref:DUF4124 domain-containing protein n=1 Tax=Allochromatium vinosum (strain ATCC 17899 / DSM 180 / NBRC 103801 / NCIMB 10441 / D) TaxID=572477 RepID=D3RPZ8_ALLVD|nr:DUF4124 domain-containing protein [Allochromatium vinosum]ADC63609.1 hypothetical protein Alvin_2700 [Allochromatium vinosum DSM 180]
MMASATRPVPPSRLFGVLLALTAGPAWAELYKCRQPDGSLSYQQTACAAQAEGDRLQVDIRGPDGRESASSGEDYSVAAQAERLRTEREARERAHLQARREAEARARALKAAAKPDRNTDFDPAKCARHRAEVAKWRQKVKGGYRTRDEKDYNDSKLAHHEALVERYCES